jgi:hypothetical protein
LAERPVEQLTLRELFANTETLIRELNEHLQQSFRPKVGRLAELVRPGMSAEDRDAIADSTIRTHVAAVLSSDDYSQALLEKLDRHLAEIREGSKRAITQE